MRLPDGTRLGPYEIVCLLGAGAMGEVYRARDPRLGRDVALKILPAAVTGDAGRLERFDREARAIAALNHPHIVTIYSTEDAGGVRFITMELVEGQTLDASIVNGGMPVARFLEIAIPLADALTSAHQKQITHRDLKPGNVMLSRDGRIKVLDFGLARVAGGETHDDADATRAALTHQGTIVGTMPYMSPEQVEGKPLDPRTDLFSLGVIFYELLSGERPFKGASSPALMSAILRDTPEAVCRRRSDLPEALGRLIGRMLEKRPEDRVQTARDIYNELRQVQKQQDSGARAGSSGAPVHEDTMRVAVLPFTVRGIDADAEAMAAGLTDDITASLAKFRGLSVAAAQSTRAYKDSALDVRQIAERIGARYVIAGNVRKSGATIRTTTQLIDAHTGTQLWSETYDRNLATLDLFAIQDDLSDHIVATVADESGVLAQSMVRSVVQHEMGDASASHRVVRSWGFQHNPTPPMHAEVRASLEARVADDADDSDLWANLANLYVCEHSLLFNALPDPLGRALRAARRAIELDRANQKGWLWLGITQFHLHDRAGMEEAFERALRINPRNANAIAWVGNILTGAGEYERGSTLTERAMAINPRHPGWLHFAVFNREFAGGNFAEALKAARRVNIPEFFWMHFAIAAACGQLGLSDEGRASAVALSRIAPPLADPVNLRDFVTRWYWPEDMIASLLDGVQRSAAGGAIENRGRGAGPAHASFLVNVMALKPTPADGDAAMLADGLTQGLVVALSRFPYLQVVGRSSTAELPRIGYVLQGTVRASAAVVRVVMHLTDAATGASIWADTYDRDRGGASLFDTQDALTETIVGTIADTSGALVRAMATTVRHTPVEALTPYEAVLRRLAYFSLMSPAEHAEVRDALEHAVRIAPTDATAWAALAGIYVDEHAQAFNPRPAPLDRARAAADTAIEIDASNPFAYAALAIIAFFHGDIEAFRPARDRAIALNPLDTGCLSYMGALTAYSGDWDTGLAMCERAMTLNPHHPGVYRIPSVIDRYRRRDYPGALDLLNRVNMPSYPNGLVMRAATCGQLGHLDEGRALVREAELRAPGITSATNDARRKWLPQALVDHIQEGLDRLDHDDGARPARRQRQGASAAAPSIAVLPFADLSQAKDQDWFCDGLAEEIINTLARLTGVKVTARTSAFFFRGKDLPIDEIARRLNVEHILEGSVRKAGNRIRVTAQLVTAADGFRLWSDRYDRELTDVFAIQDDMATAIAAQLRVQLGRTGSPRRTPHLGAYEAFLQSRHHWYKLTPAAIEKSRDLVERALSLDPGYADAYVGLGAYYFGVAWFGGADPREALPKSREAMLKALELDADSADAHAGAGAVRGILDFDWEAAGAHHRRALSIDRSPHVVLPHALWYLRPLGRLDEARVELEQLCDRDPLAAFPRSELAHVLLLMRRYDDAGAAAEQALTLETDYLLAAFTLLTVRVQQQRLDEALSIAERVVVVSGRWLIPLAYLGLVYAAAGRMADAHAVRDEMLALAGRTHTNATALATIHTALGEIDEAVRWLERAIDQREPIISTLATWPIFDAVRSHPRYPELLRAMRLPDSSRLTPRSPSGRA